MAGVDGLASGAPAQATSCRPSRSAPSSTPRSPPTAVLPGPMPWSSAARPSTPSRPPPVRPPPTSVVSHGPRTATRTRSPTATSVPSSFSYRPSPPPPPPPPPPPAAAEASRRAEPEGAMHRVRLSRPHQVRCGTGLDRAVQYPRRCLHPCQCLAARGRWRGQGAAAHQVRRRRRQHPPGWDHEPPAHPHETRPADRQDAPPEQAPRRDGDPERHRTCPDSAGHDQAQAMTAASRARSRPNGPVPTSMVIRGELRATPRPSPVPGEDLARADAMSVAQWSPTPDQHDRARKYTRP